MKHHVFLLLLGLLLGSTGSYAQQVTDSIQREIQKNQIKIEALPYYSFGKGVGLTSPDSLFQFNIRFRMQNRATFAFEEDQPDEISAQIRRLRLRFDGYVGSPQFTYALQLSFAPEDVGTLESGESINIIRDAILFYRPNAYWHLGFGQTKLPGNRQRINSSGALQLTDRSINNSRFNIDRDFGLQVYYIDNPQDSFGYEIKTALTTGSGRNWTGSSEYQLAYTGKIELYPFGNFSKGGAYFEGDLARETTPKLMVSGVYHLNQGATQSQGQRGQDLYEARDLTSVFLDAIVKYNGWSFQTAWMMRDTDQSITTNPENELEQSYVIAGSGWDVQLSYVFYNYWEIIGRYSNSRPKTDLRWILPESSQMSFGVTKYIWEHAFKMQAEITHEQLQLPQSDPVNSWYLRFQVELGI